jgi:predicted ATPase
MLALFQFQRSNFVPFIEILKQRNVVSSLDPGVDYRRRALAGSEKVTYTIRGILTVKEGSVQLTSLIRQLVS